MKAIYKRELKSYFDSMTGYVFIAAIIIFTGIYFMVYNLNMGYPYFSYALYGAGFIFILSIPILIMRCFAEERKNKTDQLLLTSPVSVLSVVLGKYFAMTTVFLVPNLIFMAFPIIIKSQGKANFLIDYAGIFTFFVMGCVYIAIGMVISALTESPVIALLSTFGVLLVMYLGDALLAYLPTSAVGNLAGILVLIALLSCIVFRNTKNWVIGGGLGIVGFGITIAGYVLKKTWFENRLAELLKKVLLTEGFENIVFNHLLDIGSLILYISLIFVFVFLTMQTIQKRRWN